MDIISKVIAIKKKKEFSKISDGLILKILQKLEKKKLREKELIKNARALLRKIIVPLPLSFYKKFDFFIQNLDKDWVLDRLLNMNRATRERKSIYPWLVNEIERRSKRIKMNIYDLGCGFNLIGLWKNGFRLENKCYIGFDVDKYIVDICNEFAKLNKINASIFHEDLTSLDFSIFGQDDLVIALKVLDSLEEIEHGFSDKIIKAKGKKLISFSLRSWGGRKIGERAWFDKLLVGKDYEKIEKDGEVFYFIGV
ncbi:MAG: class I SAM-dependent methyltransferase [Candidatus Pacearchaeota archaeon]